MDRIELADADAAWPSQFQAEARRELVFRDALRNNPELARRYEKLKQDLVAGFATDRDAYTEGKTAFVEAAIKEIS